VGLLGLARLLEGTELVLERLDAVLGREARAPQIAHLGLHLPELLGELLVAVGTAGRAEQGGRESQDFRVGESRE
jgi:hypothetical protein